MAIDPNASNFWNGSGIRDRNGAPCADSKGNAIAYEDCAGDYSFTLPVISLVIITILNDGTMITIAHDKVIPEKRPQKWAMFEVTVVSLVLGAVACLSSMIMLVLVLHSNIQHRGDWVGQTMGSGGRDYVRWQEARTMMYLKISISDFLTLFSARTRVWFWERRPGYALGAACLVATACSTLLSLFWDDAITADDAYMKGLRGSQYAVVATWIYCVLWFFVQDVAKVFTYQALEFIFREDHERMQSLLQRFYFRRSLALFDAHCAAMACVFLAGKVEEHTRSMRDVLNVCYACKLRRQGRAPRPLQRGCELDRQWKANLIRTERFVLLSLGFQMYAVSNEHPHKARRASARGGRAGGRAGIRSRSA